MLKNILNLEGAQQLSKDELKEITAGVVENPKKKCVQVCPILYVCHNDGVCRRYVEG